MKTVPTQTLLDYENYKLKTKKAVVVNANNALHDKIPAAKADGGSKTNTVPLKKVTYTAGSTDGNPKVTVDSTQPKDLTRSSQGVKSRYARVKASIYTAFQIKIICWMIVLFFLLLDHVMVWGWKDFLVGLFYEKVVVQEESPAQGSTAGRSDVSDETTAVVTVIGMLVTWLIA